MHQGFFRFWLLVASLLMAWPLAAQTKTCDALKGEQRQIATKVMQSQHPYDCCDGTVAACLKRKPVCPLAVRLADDICRRAAKGQSQKDIERELARRATSAMAPKVTIDVSKTTLAGDEKAPVEIVAYVCARCPFCARLTPQLYESVSSGKLKGKAKLVLRPFPIRSHKHSAVAAKGMLAAQKLGKLWPYVLESYANFDRFEPEKMGETAAKVGLDREKFQALLEDPEIERILIEAKKEGIRNQVDATPAIFIDRRKYEAELTVSAIEDFVEGIVEAR